MMSKVVLGKYVMWKKYEHYLNSTEKTVLPQGVGKTAPRRFCPIFFPGLIIAVYFVAYNA